MMKLFAFRDRLDDANKDFGSYHALDLYTVLAMTSEMEWNQAIALRQKHRTDPMIHEANRIVAANFTSQTSLGMLRMRASPYCRKELQLDDFCNSLQELFSIDGGDEVT